MAASLFSKGMSTHSDISKDGTIMIVMMMMVLVVVVFITIIMTQCKIGFTYAPHCVTKNVTPRRIIKKCFLAQMNPQIMVMVKSDDDYETDIFKHQGSIISAIVAEEPGVI